MFSLKICTVSLEPLTIAFVETTYIVMESEGQVEVCINLTHISNSILDFTIVVESYNNESSIGVCSNPVLASEPIFYSYSLGCRSFRLYVF